MDPYSLPISTQYETAVFTANSVSSGSNWSTWTKPLGKGFASILIIGSGGGGGGGVTGAVSTAAGGGGGGSGGMTILNMPLSLLPPRLYISVPYGRQAGGFTSYVATQPTSSFPTSIIGLANGGTAGGSGSGATGGVQGTGGSIATVASMPIGWQFAIAISGQNGVVGGSTGAGTSIVAPVTGLRVTGGAGGAGLGASGAAGSQGGSITTPSQPTPFIAQVGGLGASSATTPPGNGINGFTLTTDIGAYYYGGTGGGSTNGSATGAGLVRSSGGNGGIGCGGGGQGGALTGSSTPAVGTSYGGNGLITITCY